MQKINLEERIQMLAINYDKEQKIFNLSNGKISYILGIEKIVM